MRRTTRSIWKWSLAALLINLFTIAASIFSMKSTTAWVRTRPKKPWVLTIGILLIYVFDFACAGRAMFLDKAGKALDRKVSSAIFEHILSIKMAAGPQSFGAFASNVQQYETLRDFFTSAPLGADRPAIRARLPGDHLLPRRAGGDRAGGADPDGHPRQHPGAVPDEAGGGTLLPRILAENATLVESINGLDMIKATSAKASCSATGTATSRPRRRLRKPRSAGRPSASTS